MAPKLIDMRFVETRRLNQQFNAYRFDAIFSDGFEEGIEIVARKPKTAFLAAVECFTNLPWTPPK